MEHLFHETVPEHKLTAWTNVMCSPNYVARLFSAMEIITGKPIKQEVENTTWAKSRKHMAGPKPKQQ